MIDARLWPHDYVCNPVYRVSGSNGARDERHGVKI